MTERGALSIKISLVRAACVVTLVMRKDVGLSYIILYCILFIESYANAVSCIIFAYAMYSLAFLNLNYINKYPML